MKVAGLYLKSNKTGCISQPNLSMPLRVRIKLQDFIHKYVWVKLNASIICRRWSCSRSTKGGLPACITTGKAIKLVKRPSMWIVYCIYTTCQIHSLQVHTVATLVHVSQATTSKMYIYTIDILHVYKCRGFTVSKIQFLLFLHLIKLLTYVSKQVEKEIRVTHYYMASL